MLKFRENLLNKLSRRNREDGAGDLVTIVFILWILVSVLVAFVVLSGRFQTQNIIQQQAAAGARQIALYGGYSAKLPLNKAKVDVAKTVLNQIYKNGECTFSRCYEAPGVKCSPEWSSGLNQQLARCDITYYYEPYENDGFGFALGARQPFTVSSTYAIETYYQRRPW